MAELSSPFSCDVCGVHKGEQNRWFKVWLNPVGLVTIGTWDKRPAVPHFHCCGEEHALRKVGELLSELKSIADERTSILNPETASIQTKKEP